mgnify:FL=1
MAPEWHDLLGLKWKRHGTDRGGMDCSTVAEEVLRRMGAELPETSPHRARILGGGRALSQGRGAFASHAGETELGSFLAYMDSGFERIGVDVKSATRVGDIVIGADGEGAGKHMYIRVEEHRSVFLTASHVHGVIAVRGFSILNPIGVYRLRSDSPT